MPNRKKIVTIIGDTSSFHLGSKTNYFAFRGLVKENYVIIQEIPYDAFGVDYISFSKFFVSLKHSLWWEGINKSDILIVHGEGLTEKHESYVYPYLYFSCIAKILRKESWLVNFSMYEGKPFSKLLANFSYIACRDIITQKHLKSLGFNTVLSFDCSVLSMPVRLYSESDGSIALIRGRNEPNKLIARNTTKYNACWQWNDKNAISLDSFNAYANRIRYAQGVLSTSFHGIILAYLSGVPFLSLDNNNKKYYAMEIELLPWKERNISDNLKKWRRERQNINKYFFSLYPLLVKRARNNIKHK